MAKKGQILDDVETALNGISGIKTVSRESLSLTETDTTKLPMIFFFGIEEERIVAGVDKRQLTFHLIGEVYGDSPDSTLEDLIADTSAAVLADKKRGDLAWWTYIEGTAAQAIAKDRAYFDMEIRILYHEE